MKWKKKWKLSQIDFIKKGLTNNPNHAIITLTKESEVNKMKLTVIEIPVAEEMSNMADHSTYVAERIYTEQEKRGWEDIPNLIQFIVGKVTDEASKGRYHAHFNLADVELSNIDSRIDYVVKGRFTSEMAEFITKTFKSAGYECYARQIHLTHYGCYRTGEIALDW